MEPAPATGAALPPTSRDEDEDAARELLVEPTAAGPVSEVEEEDAPPRAPSSFEPYRPWSWPGGDPYAVEPLALGYAEDRITAMPVDPQRVFLYIEMTDESIEEARRRLGRRGEEAWFVIRVYDTTGRIFDGTNANSTFDIAIERGTRAYYVALSAPARAFVFEVGLKSDEGYFRHVARSNAVFMPRDAVAEPSEPHFITVWRRLDRPLRPRYRSLHPSAQPAPPSTPPPAAEEPVQVATLLLREGVPFAIELRATDDAFWLRAERAIGGAWRLVGARHVGGEEIEPDLLLRQLGGDASLLGLDAIPLLDVAWRAEGPILFEVRQLDADAGEERLAAWVLKIKGAAEGAVDAQRLEEYLLGGHRRMQSAWVGSAGKRDQEAGLTFAGGSGPGLPGGDSGAGVEVMSSDRGRGH